LKVIGIGLGVVAGALLLVGSVLLVFWIGLGINGGSMERRVVQEDGKVRAIERRFWGGRTGLYLSFTQAGRLDVAQSGCFDDGKRTGDLVLEDQAIGCWSRSGRTGPWLFLTSPDPAVAEIDRERSGWYRDGARLDWHPLDKVEQEDLLTAWTQAN
jgi:hypothetical protein